MNKKRSGVRNHQYNAQYKTFDFEGKKQLLTGFAWGIQNIFFLNWSVHKLDSIVDLNILIFQNNVPISVNMQLVGGKSKSMIWTLQALFRKSYLYIFNKHWVDTVKKSTTRKVEVRCMLILWDWPPDLPRMTAVTSGGSPTFRWILGLG